MASQAQIQANRANATKSTGPKTSQGKAVVSQNAVKHGLLAEQVVIAGEDPGAFEFYRQAMLEELSPVGAVETTLAERAVGLAWRLRRAERVQAEVFDSLLAKEANSPVTKLLESLQHKKQNNDQANVPKGTALGKAIIRDFANGRALDRLGMYERRIEHSLFKTMHELERLRVTREIDPSSAEKSEIRSTKSETNTNDRNHNDINRDDHRQAALDTATHDEKSEGETRGLRTHPTMEKSEIRSTKSETNSNNKKHNDPNEMVGLCETKPIDGGGVSMKAGIIG